MQPCSSGNGGDKEGSSGEKTAWPAGKEINERKRKMMEQLRTNIALHADKYHTRVMAAIYIERDQMVLSAQHPSTQSLPAGSQYKTLDLSVDLASVPLDDKVNLHMQVGQMLYN